MKEIDMIIQLGKRLDEQKEAAFELWTLLPSYRAAQIGHGDYAGEHAPSVKDIIIEANLFITHGLAPTAEQYAEAGEYYSCPCGEEHSAAEHFGLTPVAPDRAGGSTGDAPGTGRGAADV